MEEDRILVLQIAYSLVAESPEFQFEPLSNRIEMVVRTYNQLFALVDVKSLGVRQ